MARRHLTQLCKYFQHKLAVTLGDGRGRIEFPSGVCELETTGDAGTMVMRLTAADAAGLAGLKDVVARRPVRLAFRDAPEIRWTLVTDRIQPESLEAGRRPPSEQEN